MDRFFVTDCGSGWEYYSQEYNSTSFFEAYDEYRALIRQNPRNVYLFSVTSEDGHRLKTLFASDRDDIR